MSSRELSRRLGLWDSLAIVVGTIIGSGVFIVPGSIARELPSGEWMLGIWLAAGALSLCGALAFAELGAMLPHAGGQYVYLREAYSPLWGFLFSWVLLLVVRSGSTATLAVGFSIYLGYFVPLSPLLERLSAAGVILLLTALNYRTLIGGALVQNATTVLKVAGLVLVAVAALGDQTQPGVETATAPSAFGLSQIGVAMIACLWAYNGWYQAGFVAGEIKDPHRNLPISLGAGVGAVILLYMLAGPRVYFAQARDGLLFRQFAEVHPRFETPALAVVLQGVWAAILSLSGSYVGLFSFAIFAGWIFYGLAVLGVIVLRIKRPEWERPYRMWGYPATPLLFVIASLGLVANTLVTQPLPSLAGLALIASGLPVYFWMRRSQDQRT